MAVCSDIPGLTVKVKVAGNDAIEYDDEDGPQEDKNEKKARKRVFKYVESKDDLTFSVEVSLDASHVFPSPREELIWHLHVDNQKIQSSFLSHRYSSYEMKGPVRRSRDDRTWKLQPLKFSAISTGNSFLSIAGVNLLTRHSGRRDEGSCRTRPRGSQRTRTNPCSRLPLHKTRHQHRCRSSEEDQEEVSK